jgi:hypothetical protein
MYNYQAKLVFKQYIPKKLELGMLFVMFVEGKPQLITMANRFFDDQFMIDTYGYPVEMYIEEEDSNEVIAEPQDIGWFDEGEDYEDLIEFSLKQANFILFEYGGLLEIQIDEDCFDQDEQVVPVYVQQKVIIKYLEDESI